MRRIVKQYRRVVDDGVRLTLLQCGDRVIDLRKSNDRRVLVLQIRLGRASGDSGNPLAGQVSWALDIASELFHRKRSCDLGREIGDKDDACKHPDARDNPTRVAFRHLIRLRSKGSGRPPNRLENAREVALSLDQPLLFVFTLHQPHQMRGNEHKYKDQPDEFKNVRGEEITHGLNERPAPGILIVHHNLKSGSEERLGEFVISLPLRRYRDRSRSRFGFAGLHRGQYLADSRFFVPCSLEMKARADRLPKLDTEARQLAVLFHHERRNDARCNMNRLLRTLRPRGRRKCRSSRRHGNNRDPREQFPDVQERISSPVCM